MQARFSYLVKAMLLAAVAGCGGIPVGPGAVQPGLSVSNPLFVPARDADFVFDQVVDAMDDHFKIDSERRVQAIGGYLTPGRIDTFPVIATSLLEPWRRDFHVGIDTAESTLQTIRRYATAEITPAEGGFIVSLQVFRELEDLSQPQLATAGFSLPLNDPSLQRVDDSPEGGPITLGWIPQGRDFALEQQILAEVECRLSPAALPPALPAVAP